jgi:hypothetical protein
MTAITIDTYALITTLKDAGIPEQQAKAQIDAMAKFVEVAREQITHEYRLDDVTTNKDLDARIRETELKIELAKSDLQRDIEKSRADITALIIRLGFLQVGLIVALLLKVLNMI